MKTLMILTTLLLAAQATARAENCHNVCMSGFDSLGDNSYMKEYDRWVPAVFALTDEQIVRGEDEIQGAETLSTLDQMAARDKLDSAELRLITQKCSQEFSLTDKNPSAAALVMVVWVAKTKSDFGARLRSCR